MLTGIQSRTAALGVSPLQPGLPLRGGCRLPWVCMRAILCYYGHFSTGSGEKWSPLPANFWWPNGSPVSHTSAKPWGVSQTAPLLLNPFPSHFPPHSHNGMETQLSVMEPEMCLRDSTAHHSMVFSINSVRVCRYSKSKFLFIPWQEI